MSFELSAAIGFFMIAIIAYLLGSISFAVIFSKLFTKRDVREQGSGNAGMTNVLRTAGVLPGILTCVFDFAKASLSVAVGMYTIVPYLNSIAPHGISIAPLYGGMLAATCCMLGHIFPIFFEFRGGKGIMTAIGAIFLIDWRIACILLVVFAIVLLLTKIISISSICAAATYPIATFLIAFFAKSPQPDGSYHLFFLPLWLFETIGAVIMAAITILKHRDNIRRLIRGEEKKMTIKK